MFVDGNYGAARQAHIIVCGNEKGGSGKTTTAMHVAVSLLNSGFRVATIDLDVRQASLTSYITNRKRSKFKENPSLKMPDHFRCRHGSTDSISTNENVELGTFAEVLNQVELTHDFVIVDTPGHDSYLMRLAHSMADTLITPMNDSYIDFDVLGKIDPMSGEVIELSHYANMVREARRHRRRVDNGLMDWIVVRNRLSHLGSRNEASLLESLKDLSMRLGCRLAEGISERVVFRELFPIGMTALDEMSEATLGNKPTLSHLSARQEIRQVVNILRLPIDKAGKQRADARKTWLDSASKAPVDKLNIFAD